MPEKITQVPVNAEYDEIELIDYINVLCKRKKLILGGTLLCIFAAAVVTFLLPSVYHVDTIIEIGTTQAGNGRVEPIERPEALLAKIKNDVYDDAVRKKLGIDNREPLSIKVENPKGTSLIKLWLESSRKEEAGKILDAVNEQILSGHHRLIGIGKDKIVKSIQTLENKIAFGKNEKAGILKGRKLIRKNRDQLKEQIKDVQKQIKELQRKKSKVNRKANSKNALTLLIFNNEIQENRRYYNELQDKLNIGLEKDEINLNRQLNENENTLKSIALEKEKLQARQNAFRETRVVKKVTISEDPVRPKKRLNIILAGTAGFCFFVFLAFFLEYLKSAKERKDLPHMEN